MPRKHSLSQNALTRRQFFAVTGASTLALAAAENPAVQAQQQGSCDPAAAISTMRVPTSLNGMRYILTERTAWMMPPPVMVAPPRVTQAKWSQGGDYILSVREDMRLPNALPPPGAPVEPKGEVSLVVFESASHRSSEVWKKPLGSQRVVQIEWLPATSLALAMLQWQEKVQKTDSDGKPYESIERHQKLLMVDASKLEVHNMSEISEEDTLSASPLSPFAVLYQSGFGVRRVPQTDGKDKIVEQAAVTLRPVRPDSVIGKPLTLPNDFIPDDFFWSEDGSLFYVKGRAPRSEAKKPPEFRWAALNPRTGDLQIVSVEPKAYAEKPSAFALELKQTAQSVGEGETAERVKTLWLESAHAVERPRTLICADGEWGSPSPLSNGVLYYSQGAAWVTPLLRVPRDQFVQARVQALKATAMSNAKQLGLGLIMYAQDYDETLPAASADVKTLIQPYLKNTDITDSLNYTFPGGTLASIQSPADTILGSVAGPCGQAIIYVDGHVKWKENP